MSEKGKGYYANKLAYIKRYNKENYKIFCIRLHKEHDAVIIKHLESKDNKQKYVRDLIADDINRAK